MNDTGTRQTETLLAHQMHTTLNEGDCPVYSSVLNHTPFLGAEHSGWTIDAQQQTM